MSDIGKPPLLKLLMIIVDWENAGKISEMLQHSLVHHHYQCKAMGTANSEILDFFGLESMDKSLTFCLAPQVLVEDVLIEISKEFSLHKKGKGIAFTLPLNSAGISILSLLNEDVQEKLITHIKSMEREVVAMNADANYNLIVAIINHGYSEELMEAAKEAGATGGTIIHARSVGSEEPMRFLGISVLPEKEMVFILTSRETKTEIMTAISQKCGLNSEARGMVFALPVDSVATGRE